MALTNDLRQSGPQHKVWGRRFLGQKPEAGSSGCVPPHGLWEAPSPAHGVLAESAPLGQFPSLSLPSPPQLRGPLKPLAHGPFIQPQLVTLAHLADLGRLLGYLYDQSHHCGLSSFCDLLPRDTPQCWAGASAVTAQQGHRRARPHRIVFTLSLGC